MFSQDLRALWAGALANIEEVGMAACNFALTIQLMDIFRGEELPEDSDELVGIRVELGYGPHSTVGYLVPLLEGPYRFVAFIPGPGWCELFALAYGNDAQKIAETLGKRLGEELLKKVPEGLPNYREIKNALERYTYPLAGFAERGW